MRTELTGRCAVVTGGGTGIGAAAARALAAAGARVILAGRRRERVDQVSAEIASAGGKASSVACDVADPAAVARLMAQAGASAGAVDILVNNAGIAESAPIRGITLESWNRHFLVNATAAMLCTQAALPGMYERRWGRVVNVASVAGLSGAPYVAAYAASKHALLGFTRVAAAESAEKGVTVNAVCPGFVDTDLTRASVDRIVAKTGVTREEALHKLEAMSPQKRLLTAQEVAFAVVFLCDERARGINGQAIVMDGGALLA